MRPFQWPTGQITRDAYKAMLLQLDPLDDEAERKLRDALALSSQQDITRALRKQLNDLIPVGATDAEVIAAASRVTQTHGPVKDALSRAIQNGADLGVNASADQFETIALAFDWDMVHVEARDWANRYAGELVTRIDSTTREAVNQSVTRWLDNGEPLSKLRDDLIGMPGSPFSPERAKLIAQTETTRAYAEGTIISYQESGLVTGEPTMKPPRDTHPGCRCGLALVEDGNGNWNYIWKTAQDELVCPICGPLANKIIPTVGAAPKQPMPAEQVAATEPTVEPQQLLQPPGTQVPTFKNKKEAESWIVDNGYAKVSDFGKIDLGVIQDIADRTVYNMDRFPKSKGTLQFVGSAQRKNALVKKAAKDAIERDIWDRYRKYYPDRTDDQLQKLVRSSVRRRLNELAPRVPGNTWAMAYKDAVVFNEKYAKNADDILEGLVRSEASGWHPPQCNTIKSVVDHEFGHVLDNVYELTRGGSTSEAKNKLIEMLRLADSSGGIKKSVSSYAATNNAEFWAESWAEYLTSSSPRAVSKAYGDWFVDYAGGK